MPKGRVLRGQSRQLVLQLHHYFEQENQNGGPLIPISQVRSRVAAAFGISRTTVTKITTEAYGRSGLERNKVSTPKTKRRPRDVTAVDNFDADAIRRHVYDYYLKKEIPTLRKLLVSLKRSGVFLGQKSSLAKVLRIIGFSYKKSDKRKILTERTDIASARCEFLRQAKKIQDWTNIVFTGETCLKVNHTVSGSQADDAAPTTSAVPSGKGERLVICHAATAEGFIQDTLLVLKAKRSGDYREEMNAVIYEEWFKIMLLALNESSIIFVNNAPYHCRQIDKMPAQGNTKQEIINWLRENGENVYDSMLKIELLRILKAKKKPKRYAIDEMAAEYGHTVVRIPPYHCQYNAIELIWAQIKSHAARHNTNPPFTANKMLQLVENACSDVTTENWASAVEGTKRVIMSDWDRDIAFDNLCTQELFVNITEDSSSDESSTNSTNSSSDDEE